LRTDADGRVTVRGFLGEYRVAAAGLESPFPLTAGTTELSVTL